MLAKNTGLVWCPLSQEILDPPPVTMDTCSNCFEVDFESRTCLIEAVCIVCPPGFNRCTSICMKHSIFIFLLYFLSLLQSTHFCCNNPQNSTSVLKVGRAVKARSHGAATVVAMATLTIGFHSVQQQMTYYVMCRCHCCTEWVLNLFTCGTVAAAAAVWMSPLVTMESNCCGNIFLTLPQPLPHRVNGP